MTKTLSMRKAYDLICLLLDSESSTGERQEAFHDLVANPITTESLGGGVKALKEKMIRVILSSDAIDTCGTGGSGLKTINTSTVMAFIVAAAGGKVAKHGNRSASGNCGCFDLLEELGVRIDLKPEEERRMFEELGIAFLFAPLHHPALRHVAPLRKEYGKKTLFNLLGPLCNPAGVKHQLLGTGNKEHGKIIAEALRALGQYGSMVVTGHDGLDEVTVTTETTIRTVKEKGIETTIFSLSHAHPPEDIVGGTPMENAQIFLEIAKGKGGDAHRNLVLANAAHALLLTNLARSFSDALALAAETLASGKVHNLFIRYRDLSHSL